MMQYAACWWPGDISHLPAWEGLKMVCYDRKLVKTEPNFISMVCLLQAKHRSEAAEEHLMHLIKKLLLIVSRPARLLECLVSTAG